MSKTTLEEFYEFLKERSYFIGNDIYHKYNELRNKEKNVPPKVYMGTVEFKGKAYESDLYYFRVTKNKKDDETYFDDVIIEFKDKREKPWKEHYFDNVDWMLGVLYSSEDALKHAKEMMCEQGIKELQAVVNDLLVMKWI